MSRFSLQDDSSVIALRFAGRCQWLIGQFQLDAAEFRPSLMRALLDSIPKVLESRGRAVVEAIAVEALLRMKLEMSVPYADCDDSALVERVSRHGFWTALVATRLLGRPVDLETTHPTVLAAFVVIERRYAEDGLRLNDVARAVERSPAYVDRLLKRHTGISFSELLRCIRITHAEFLLVSSQHSIKEIAIEVGFKYVASFDRAFHRIRACSPSAWRLPRRRGESLTKGRNGY